MAHPFQSHREDKIMGSRVAHIAKGHANGGAVSPAKAVHAHEKHMHKGEKETKLATGGAVAKPRLDRYARGGKVKPKGTTNVNVIITSPQSAEKPPADLPLVGAGMLPPTPPVAAASPPPPMPPGAPPMLPPGMPMRARGGRISDGPAWKEGLKNGTKVQHTDGKNDGDDIYRGRQITYKRGGAVEASNAKGPKMPGGAYGGEGRLAKAALQRRSSRP